MTDVANKESPNIAIVRAYFEKIDAQSDDLFDLFTDGFEFYFPKYGFGYGVEDFIAFGAAFREVVSALHDQDNIRFIDAGDKIICEGTTYGTDYKGASWKGGETAGGRYCSVYELIDGKIAKMRIYVDPDYTSEDEERFRWGKDRRW